MTEQDHSERVGYLEAIDELDTILAELDADTIDVDELATKVARASALIELCRDRITEADLQVREITDSLDPRAPDDPTDDAGERPD